MTLTSKRIIVTIIGMVNYLFVNFLWELSWFVWMCREISSGITAYSKIWYEAVTNLFVGSWGPPYKSTNSNIIRPHGKSLSICETFYTRGRRPILWIMKSVAWTDCSWVCVWMLIRFSYFNLLLKSSRESSLQTKKYVNSRVNSADT